MSYIDGFVVPVHTADKETYIKHAQTAAAVFKECGALAVVEAWGTDVPDGKLTSFPLAVQCKPEETVVFSWIMWPDKRTRDSGMKKSMEDKRLTSMEMPFDGKRMIFGGFEVVMSV